MLLYTEWINNKALLYNSGNYTQYPMINHNGKRILKNVSGGEGGGRGDRDGEHM